MPSNGSCSRHSSASWNSVRKRSLGDLSAFAAGSNARRSTRRAPVPAARRRVEVGLAQLGIALGSLELVHDRPSLALELASRLVERLGHMLRRGVGVDGEGVEDRPALRTPAHDAVRNHPGRVGARESRERPDAELSVATDLDSASFGVDEVETGSRIALQSVDARARLQASSLLSPPPGPARFSRGAR